jgi:chromosome segregation ATPase
MQVAEKIAKMRSATPSTKAKNTSSIIRKNSSNRQAQQEEMKQCLKQVQYEREKSRIDFQGKIESLQEQVAFLEKNIVLTQEALKHYESQRAKEKADNQQNRAQITQERMAEMQSLYNKLVSNQTQTQQKIQQIQSDMTKAQKALAKASNDLATAHLRPDGEFSLDEAAGLEQRYRNVHQRYEKFCQEEKDDPQTTSPSHLRTSK